MNQTNYPFYVSFSIKKYYLPGLEIRIFTAAKRAIDQFVSYHKTE